MEEKIVEVKVDLSKEEPIDAEVAAPEAVTTPVTEATEFVVPEKFKNKSLEDVIASYSNLEKEHGRKSNEVHKLRELTDQILQQNVDAGKPAAPAAAESDDNEVGFDDLIADPAAAVNKALRNNPAFQRMERDMTAQSLADARGQLKVIHPDSDDVLKSEEFQEWVQASPGRLTMLTEAHNNHDVGLASDVLGMYKATQGAAQEEAITERAAIAAAELKEAKVESGSVGTAKSVKIYSRQELIHLKMTNPTRYKAMSPEIHLAYAEGRVR